MLPPLAPGRHYKLLEVQYLSATRLGSGSEMFAKESNCFTYRFLADVVVSQ